MRKATSPWQRTDNNADPWSKTKTVLGAVFLLPIRVALFMTAITLYWLVVKVATIGVDLSREGLPASRRWLIVWPGKLLARTCLLALGFWWIEFNPCQDPKRQAGADAPLVVVNHVSYCDIFLHMYLSLPAFISKASVANVPMVGTIAKSMSCVFVERGKKSNTTQLLGERYGPDSEPGRHPPVVIFPEGTTSNGRFVTHFHKGAFLLGQPVHVMVVEYPHKTFSPADSHMNELAHLGTLFSQGYNSLRVTDLGVYRPSKPEQTDASLYARNVQRLMAAALNVPVSEQTFKDKVEFSTNVSKMLK